MQDHIEAKIIDLVRNNAEGMPALELFQKLISIGVPTDDVQNALQRALDKGLIKAGRGFVLTTDAEKAKAFA